MSEIKTFFRHCPSCGRRFEIRLVSKKAVGEKSEFVEADMEGAGPIEETVGDFVSLGVDAPVIVDEKDFRYSYRCKHCGHRWSEVHEELETAKAPKDYSGD